MNLTVVAFNAAIDPNILVHINPEAVSCVSPAPSSAPRLTPHEVTVIYTSGGPFPVLGTVTQTLEALNGLSKSGDGRLILESWTHPAMQTEPQLLVPTHVPDGNTKPRIHLAKD